MHGHYWKQLGLYMYIIWALNGIKISYINYIHNYLYK